jgi:hypothetical protein
MRFLRFYLFEYLDFFIDILTKALYSTIRKIHPNKKKTTKIRS